MKRDPIDQAAIAQWGRLINLLHHVEARGGKATWPQVHPYGFRIPTIKSAIKQGYLREAPYRWSYKLTANGRRYLDMSRYTTKR